jgi:hypothetical protein
MMRRISIPTTVLRTQLENARIDLLALFRALDRMDLLRADIPQKLLRRPFELDADYAKALWALDHAAGRRNPWALLRDTLAALDQLPDGLAQFRKRLPPRAHSTLANAGAVGSPQPASPRGVQPGAWRRSP